MTPPYVHSFKTRHGKRLYYFRRRGAKQVPLPGAPGSSEFHLAYAAALAGLEIEKRSIGESRTTPGSIGATIAAYYTDRSFVGFAPSTKAKRRQILERLREQHGEKMIARIERQHVVSILGKLKPFAARNWLKTLRGLMQFAVGIGLCSQDPTVGIKPAKARPGTIHTWTEDEIEIFERHHAPGSRARLALYLLLYTAVRRGDAVGLGAQHIRAGRIHYRQQKTGRALAIPLHEALTDEIARHKQEHLTFLVTAHGKPFSAGGFSNWFREVCNSAGLPQCSCHGLRKAQARRLAEAGCSTHEIAAITGHKTLSEVQRYTAAAEQSKLADAAIRTVSRTQSGKPARR